MMVVGAFHLGQLYGERLPYEREVRVRFLRPGLMAR